jgi:TatD DNase family protein
MLIDTHCHLFMEPLSTDVEGVLQRASLRGVSEVVVPAVEISSWEMIKQLSEYPSVHPALGLHPWCADEKLDMLTLKALMAEVNAVAVGEIGLDFKIDFPSRTMQEKVFRSQLDLALELCLPVILHCRGAFDEMLSILSEKRYRGILTGVIHAFTRGPELAARFLDLGFYLAFGGAVTRPGARRARKSASVVPLDRILLETDAPSIGMDSIDPENVEPSNIAEVARALTTIRDISFDEVSTVTSRNACILFGF